MRTTKAPRRAEAFIVTKEHRRFMEFANVVRKERYIGLCYGAAGVGKTQSARRYAHWQSVEPLLTRWGPRDEADKKVYATLARSRVLFFTPDVRANFGALRHQIDDLLGRINICIDQHTGKTARTLPWDYVELVVLDEAERLNTAALEYLRDLFDGNDIGLILIGMPGIEKRMSRYPQLYSRVGFAHHYRPLLGDELSFVLTRHWQKLGLQLDGARLHRRSGSCEHCKDHRRQLPASAQTIPADRAGSPGKRANGDHRRRGQCRSKYTRNRRQLALKKARQIALKVTE